MKKVKRIFKCPPKGAICNEGYACDACAFYFTAHLELKINCGNTAMAPDEEQYIEQEFRKIIEARGMKVETFFVG